jgi:hypothetical protein
MFYSNLPLSSRSLVTDYFGYRAASKAFRIVPFFSSLNDFRASAVMRSTQAPRANLMLKCPLPGSNFRYLVVRDRPRRCHLRLLPCRRSSRQCPPPRPSPCANWHVWRETFNVQVRQLQRALKRPRVVQPTAALLGKHARSEQKNAAARGARWQAHGLRRSG